ncbi:MAG TPA: glycoside hydrolase family 3 C-terminal domain-containing protein [Aggregatilineaceae bacterium]|nr:glycoside hydrolase family 3 C-terminal domain-containing protein [Aggregatilineaceae bacterium]
MMFKKDDCTLNREQIEEKAQALLAQMTLKEKVWMLNGNWDPMGSFEKYQNMYNPVPIETNGCPRLGVSPIGFSDGPRGVVMGHSTCFPVSIARGASFDPDLEKRIGDVIGQEARAQGANYFGGVCINLLRHPAWGRSQETYGEDPFLLGEMGKALTEGVQKHNVIACVKHYAVNNIENSRFWVNVNADERTMREVYLPHFKKCIDAGAASVMGAYNLFNGDHCCESHTLLTDILRDDWGFEGFVISDFVAGVRDTQKAIEAGLDIEMPMPIHYQHNLLKAVEEGRVSEETVDTAVLRVLRALLVFEHTPEKITYSMGLVASTEHTTLAREVAEKSVVLIKNTKGVLPFQKTAKRVLVAGELGNRANTGDAGSSNISAPYVVTLLEGLRNYFGDDAEIVFCNESELDKAAAEAARVDCVIIAVGNDKFDEGEYIGPDTNPEFSFGEAVAKGYENMGKSVSGFGEPMPNDDGAKGGDRKSLSLKPAQIELIKRIGSINPNTVVVLIGGGMIMTKEWEDAVPAIVYGWYSGMEGGNALPRILFGDVNPSGKLPFTIPQDTSHLPYFSNTDAEITYDLYHGYSYLDKHGYTPAYPFGFGLSYTTWEYGEPHLDKQDDHIILTVDLKNTGDVAGAEVVQVYVGIKQSAIDRQKKLLKGFKKIDLEPGKSTTVSIPVALDELRYFSNEQRKWVFEPGTYQFYVGSSSAEADVQIKEVELS